MRISFTRPLDNRLPGAAALCACLIAVSLIAACSPALQDAQETAPPLPSPTEPPRASSTPEPDLGELDLREANVLAVELEPLGDGRFRFHVTLLHDDDGEAPDFADWWQVEDTQGNVLGRRILTHSHGTQAFTRSEVITIPANVTIVIVRGHDMQHAYGGQSMRVDVGSGLATPFDENRGVPP